MQNNWTSLEGHMACLNKTTADLWLTGGFGSYAEIATGIQLNFGNAIWISWGIHIIATEAWIRYWYLAPTESHGLENPHKKPSVELQSPVSRHVGSEDAVAMPSRIGA